MMKLEDGERVEVAWPEHASGPGWSNEITWVVVRKVGGGLRLDAIQPGERTVAMASLFDVCASAAKNFTEEVVAAIMEK